MVKDTQVKGLFKAMSKKKPLYISARQAGMSENTARKYVKSQRFPSDLKQSHTWRTRPDPFIDVWPQVEAILSRDPHFEAKAAFQWLQQENPGKFSDNQVRTLQRRFRQWHALYGSSKEVFFPQEHHPGALGASDFTSMSELRVTIAGVIFDHLLYHFVLTWSNWEHGTICFSESFESLASGLQNALWRCGGVPDEHRTDRLSAAVSNLDERKDFTSRYGALLRHYNMEGQKTNPNSGHENGDAEQRHYRFKRAMEQALILRCSRDFASRKEYELFLEQLFDRLNAGRQDRFEEEQRHLRPLPARRLPEYADIRGVLVSKASTILIRKNVYSVHSRLRDEHVTVHLYSERLDVLFGADVVEHLPRLRGTAHHRINYRHIIDWLVRKPGAFANYRYRSDLFPTSHFRIAYDMLCERIPAYADREYLQILHCAARQSEELVNRALQKLVAQGALLSAPAVIALVGWLECNAMPAPMDTSVAEVELSLYDNLLTHKEAMV